MSNRKLKPITAAIGTAFVASLATASIASADAPFGAVELQKGYDLLAQADVEGKCGDDKSAEGSCGDDKSAEGSCGDDKDAEGSCGDDKAAEGSCGGDKDAEGSCGGSA